MIARKIIIFSLFLIPMALYAQEVKVIKVSALEQIMTTPSEKIQVINFWATWCPPCVKELPLFEKISSQRKDIQVYLVSLDADLDPDLDKVRRFVVKKALKSPVYALVEDDANTWINKVDASWSGAIPATLFINPNTRARKFVEGELDEQEVVKWINSLK